MSLPYGQNHVHLFDRARFIKPIKLGSTVYHPTVVIWQRLLADNCRVPNTDAVVLATRTITFFAILY